MKVNEALGVMDPQLKDKSSLKPKAPKRYMCILHNDDYTDGEALIELISKHFKHDRQTSMSIVIKAHREGKAPCGGPYGKDEAETRADAAMKAATQHPAIGGGPAPLLISVEEVPSDEK